MTNQRGFTLNELLVAIFGLGVIALVIAAGWAAIHFIAKFW